MKVYKTNEIKNISLVGGKGAGKTTLTGVVRKYSARIMAMTEEKTPVWKTFSLKGYLIIAFMISLGISLKHIPGVPFTFFAWFHTGLGLGLLSAGIRFLLRWYRELSSRA